MAFDKAKCAQCPLKKHWKDKGCWSPVGFENHGDDGGVLVLGEGPSKAETQYQMPFSDSAGAYVVETLKELGKDRKDVSWGNIIGCRWPDDDPKTYLARLRASNRRRAKQGKPLIMSPIEACAVHTRDEMSRVKTVISLGSYATKFVY